MEFDRTGQILYVIRYPDCVAFYRDVIGLEVLFDTDALTCFDFGGSYLMVELDDETSAIVPEVPMRDRTCLRFNVVDVKAWADKLSKMGIAVDYQVHNWGTVAKFRDPDGNLLAFKDAVKFNRQVEAHSILV